MPVNEFVQEIAFGLENLNGVHARIAQFAQMADSPLKVSALTYECLGYYNAIEHLIIRTLKYVEAQIPSGSFSHRDTLKLFINVVTENNAFDQSTIAAIEDLMAFRHVATKIYGFLINWDKLQVIVDEILLVHPHICALFETATARLAEGR